MDEQVIGGGVSLVPTMGQRGSWIPGAWDRSQARSMVNSSWCMGPRKGVRKAGSWSASIRTDGRTKPSARAQSHGQPSASPAKARETNSTHG